MFGRIKFVLQCALLAEWRRLGIGIRQRSGVACGGVVRQRTVGCRCWLAGGVPARSGARRAPGIAASGVNSDKESGAVWPGAKSCGPDCRPVAASLAGRGSPSAGKRTPSRARVFRKSASRPASAHRHRHRHPATGRRLRSVAFRPPEAPQPGGPGPMGLSEHGPRGLRRWAAWGDSRHTPPSCGWGHAAAVSVADAIGSLPARCWPAGWLHQVLAHRKFIRLTQWVGGHTLAGARIQVSGEG
jgi:hypothetical protein